MNFNKNIYKYFEEIVKAFVQVLIKFLHYSQQSTHNNIIKIETLKNAKKIHTEMTKKFLQQSKEQK